LNFRNLTSDLRLGLRLLFLQPFKKLLADPGRVTFEQNFFPEGLLPTSAADRLALDAASRCIGCGLCDAAPGLGPRPSLLPTTFSKQSSDLAVLGADLGALPAEKLEIAEVLCPRQVPLLSLHRFLVARRAALGEATRNVASGRTFRD
jgi:hypothetical protein